MCIFKVFFMYQVQFTFKRNYRFIMKLATLMEQNASIVKKKNFIPEKLLPMKIYPHVYAIKTTNKK